MSIIQMTEQHAVASRNTTRIQALLVLLLSVGATRALAADSCRFTESYKDVVACAKDPDSGDFACNEFGTGTFTIQGTFFTDGSLSKFTNAPSTSVNLSVGNWTFSDTIDHAIAASQRSVTFALTHPVTDKNGNTKTVRHGTIKLRYVNMKGLIVTISAKAGTDKNGAIQGYTFEDWILASAYDDAPTGAITDATTASIELDTPDTSYTASADMNVTGQVTTKTLNARDGSSYTVSSIRLKGIPAP